MVKVSRRSDGGKSTKMSFKNVRYGAQKTVSKHLKRLKPHKSKLLYLTRKKPSLKQKKQVLNQKGALTALGAPLAVDLLGIKFSNEERSKNGDDT